MHRPETNKELLHLILDNQEQIMATLASLQTDVNTVSTKLDSLLAQGVPGPADQATIDAIDQTVQGMSTKLDTALGATPPPAPTA
jgi:hypothetical protein